ncbi:hypothetical protein [Faecalicatena faecalis]|uniref:hypothetical protein n=1 Tax=Faecalicatena faecalis TaxID=2726362 RepID=UPI001C0CA822|nr:hypothetical protein [Faecalicatena faecalis]
MVTTENYEVLRFIEHGGKSRIIMDCASGQLLVQRLKDCSGMTKDQVFKWFRVLTEEAEKYSRCKNGQTYRYLNPYSILVTEEENLLLLDMSAESNANIIKYMQTPKVRKHFTKPIVQINENTRLSADLYSLGKTIQFILAHTEAYISLTRREEYLLSGIIEKCLGTNPKKKYENLRQVQKEISNITCKQEKKQRKKSILIIAAIVLLFVGICVGHAAGNKKEIINVQAAIENREESMGMEEQE